MYQDNKFFLYILRNKLAIFLIIFILAIVGYKTSLSMTKGVFPNVFFPRIEVTILNGYTPIKQMLYTVTKPSEEALKTVQDVTKIISNTSIGSSTIDMYFNWNINPYLAYQLVQARVAEIRSRLPLTAKIQIVQATPSQYPISIYSICSNTLSRAQLTQKLYYDLRPIFLSIKGVYKIQMKAPSWSEYKLLLNTKKMHRYGLNIQNIITQLKAQNVIKFLGIINDYHKQYILSLYQKRKHASKLLNLDINLGHFRFIKLSDIAILVKGVAPTQALSQASGFKNAVVFNLLRQPNADAVALTNAFNTKLKQLAPKLKKQGITIVDDYDGSTFTKEAIKSVRDAIILGGIIAVLVIFFFLRKPKLSLVSLVIIPISFLITMIGMKLFGIGFNIFSLGGMAAALGGLIDQMIIVIENIERHFKGGMTKKEAVIFGSREILPIMAVATTLAILVFIPLLLVSGVVGLFYKQLAFVLVATYIISQIIAIFLTPIVAFIALPNKPESKPDFMEPFVEKYKSFLHKALSFSWISLPLLLALFAISFYLFKSTPSTFLPKWDEGNIVVDFTLPSGISLRQSVKEFQIAEKIFDNTPEVKDWTMRVGTSLGNISTPTNIGDFLVTLKKSSTRSSFEVMSEFRKKLQAAIPNLVDLGLSQVLGDRLGDIMGAGAAPITIRLFGSNSQELIKESRKLKKVFMGIRNINEVNVQTSYSSAAINVRLKNNALALYGISAKMLQTQIRSLYYGKIIASVMKGDKIINVRVFMSRPTVDPIIYLQKELLIYSPKLHKNIPLNFVATIKYQTKVPQITHYNLSTVSVIGIRFAGNNMSTVIHNIKQKLSHIKLPANINIQIGGFYKQQQKSFKQMGYVIGFALLIIFTGLLLYFSSLRISVTILLALVVTLAGVFLALKITGKPLDITSLMGMLIVLSIVINNNVLIYDFYQKNENPDEKKRIVHAIGVRMRPVLMTMFSNAFALLPIALAIGSGTQIIQDMAIAIMGGLFFAIIINLFIMPLFFYWLYSMQLKRSYISNKKN